MAGGVWSLALALSLAQVFHFEASRSFPDIDPNFRSFKPVAVPPPGGHVIVGKLNSPPGESKGWGAAKH